MDFISRNIINKKIIQSDWTKAFWAINCEPEFPQVWDLHAGKQRIQCFSF